MKSRMKFNENGTAWITLLTTGIYRFYKKNWQTRTVFINEKNDSLLKQPNFLGPWLSMVFTIDSPGRRLLC